MSYRQDQSFNDWNKMLGEIYDKTQNYSKSAYEIHCHLTEVTGGFGKYFIKKRNYEEAKSFLPSIFAWALALIRKVIDNQRKVAEIDKIIFKKFPGVCPYCLKPKCVCTDEKNTESYYQLEQFIYKFTIKQDDNHPRIKDIKQMLSEIYSETWNKYHKEKKKGIQIRLQDKKEIARYNITFLFSRMTEELAEIAESIRFYHLYKSNFENEMADFFAWYFAIVSSFHELYDDPGKHKIDIEKLLWKEFPGLCCFCNMPKCVCRPGPVRELLSRPSIDEYQNYDEATQTENSIKLKEYIKQIDGLGEVSSRVFPISTIKITITNYSEIKPNKELYGKFLREISSILRSRIRYDKHKFYRKADDELFILCHDTLKKENEALQERIEQSLLEKDIYSTYSIIKFDFELNTFNEIAELRKIL